MRAVAVFDHVNGEPRDRVLTEETHAFLFGTGDNAWPMTVTTATAWMAYMLGTREARAMKKRKRPPPRGKGYRADIEKRSEELARAAIAELLTHQLILVIDDPAQFNRYLLEGDPTPRLDETGATTYYMLGSVATQYRAKGFTGRKLRE